MKELFIKRYRACKALGDKTLEQLNKEELLWQFNEQSNSIAIIIKHMTGNMLSRWTNFLTEDGEKKWRNRDNEFVNDFNTKEEIVEYWEKGWKCLFEALEKVNDNDMEQTIYIRDELHTVADAILRQLSHYSLHVGQIIYIAKMIKGKDWKTLSIPLNKSKEYNKEIFSKSSENEQENASSVCYANSKDVRKDYK